MQRYRNKNVFLGIALVLICIYGVHYKMENGIFTRTTSVADSGGESNGGGSNGGESNGGESISRAEMSIETSYNKTDAHQVFIDYTVRDHDGKSHGRSGTRDRMLGNEPRLRRPNQKKMNVLFIMADDMRAQIGPYNGPDSEYIKPDLHTPHFDLLAGRSLLLKKAFVQYTFCGPSRTSLLTSRRPDVTGVYDNKHHWRHVRGNYTSLPQYFKANGYSVKGIGKVYHPGDSSGNNDPLSWTEQYDTGGSAEYDYLKPYGPGERWIKVSPEEESAKPLPDRVAVKKAIEYLTTRAEHGGKPFFLGFGFHKPHVSLICPKKYYDLYPEEKEEQFLSEKSWQRPLFRPGTKIINGTVINDSWSQLPTETLRHYRQAYFACISYVDDLLGELLGALEELKLSDSTIVSFMADHGYHLGEQKMVGKQTLYDSSSHVPLMIHVPGRTDEGVVSSSIVEALDVFPTLVEAAGLPSVQPCGAQSVDITLCTEGKSLLSLIDKPLTEIKEYAITQQMDPPDRMRFSIRSDRYRLTLGFWRDLHVPGSYRPIKPESKYHTVELYDHDKDREERHNMAGDKKYTEVKEQLKDSLYEMINIAES